MASGCLITRRYPLPSCFVRIATHGERFIQDRFAVLANRVATFPIANLVAD